MLKETIAATTISAINRLPAEAQREVLSLLVPPELLSRFNLAAGLHDSQGHDLLTLNCPAGGPVAGMELRHRWDAADPVLFGEITDTIHGQIHVLLYILNDPDSPRFSIDRMPDGRSTKFGTVCRNLPAEAAAMAYGLAPGQVRGGLRLLGAAIQAFERFVAALGQEMYFVEPLYYHNAIIFERYGFAYQKGRRLMERIHAGFMGDGDLQEKLDGSSPFRLPGADAHIRLRSWAIHDLILGEPFQDVTMYKYIGKSADIRTSQQISW